MALSAISRLIGVVVEFSVIAKIHKYKRLHGRHHFILMSMDVHGTPKSDVDNFIKKCAHFFHDRRLEGHLSFFFHSIFQATC